VLSVLKQKAHQAKPGLTNAEIRQITHLDRAQVKRLMTELSSETGITVSGRGRGAFWRYEKERDNG